MRRNSDGPGTPVRIVRTMLETPVGPFVALHRDGRLLFADFRKSRAEHEAKLRRRFGRIEIVDETRPGDVMKALRRYLKGDVTAIDALATDTIGTPFQEMVWMALRKIPAGQTMSYAELAAKIGRPSAIRAVARANALNPVGVIVPCHRVIGSNGKLTGYASGLNRKAWLLAHERKHAHRRNAAGVVPDLFAGLL